MCVCVCACAYTHARIYTYENRIHMYLCTNMYIIVAVLIRIQYKPSKITCFASILSSLVLLV